MADKNITIGIKTTGADAAAASIRKVDVALDNASTTLNSGDGFTGAAEVARDSMQRFQTQAGSMSVAGNQMRSTISNVGYQIQDFAVQTASGTSAVRAFAQQAPQLLSAFGPWGIVAGTAVAVAAPLAAALFNVGESAKEAGVKVDDMSEAIAEANRRLIAGITEGLDAQLQEQAKLRTQIGEVAAAERTAAAATLENDEKIRQSKTAIAEALGLQIDKYKEIEATADAAAAKRKLEAENAIATEKAELEKTRLERQQAEANVANERRKLADLQAEKERSDKALNDLYARRAALEATAGQKMGFFEVDPIKKSEIRTAQKQLDNPQFQSDLKELEDRVSQLQGKLDGFEGEKGSLRAANVKLQEMINREAEKSQESSVEIDRLEQNLQADDLAIRTKKVADLQQQQATDMKAAVSQIEATDEIGRAAKERIETAARDGSITANEIDQVARDSVTLVGRMQAGVDTAGANQKDVLSTLSRFIANQEAFKTQMKNILTRLEILEGQ